MAEILELEFLVFCFFRTLRIWGFVLVPPISLGGQPSAVAAAPPSADASAMSADTATALSSKAFTVTFLVQQFFYKQSAVFIRFVFGFLFQSRIADRETNCFDALGFVVFIPEHFQDVCFWERYGFGIDGIENKHD